MLAVIGAFLLIWFVDYCFGVLICISFGLFCFAGFVLCVCLIWFTTVEFGCLCFLVLGCCDDGLWCLLCLLVTIC